MNKHVKLKPCPFCGGENLLTEPSNDESYVHCQDCKADGPAGDYVECEKLWNNRAREAPLAGLDCIKRVTNKEQVDEYISCAQLEAGHYCEDEWFQSIDIFLRSIHN